MAEQSRYVYTMNKPYGKTKSSKPEFYDEIAEVVGEDPADFYPRVDAELVEDHLVKPREKDPLAYSLHSLLKDGVSSPSHLSLQGTEALAVLARLTSILEQREAANQKFQHEILEMEREKLRYVQRFVEDREKFNIKRLHLMREWIMNQPKAKRKRGGD